MPSMLPVANRSFPIWVEGTEFKLYVIVRYNHDLPTATYNQMVASTIRTWTTVAVALVKGAETLDGNIDTSPWMKATELDSYPSAQDEPYITVWGHPQSGTIPSITCNEQTTPRQLFDSTRILMFGLGLFTQHASKLGVSLTRPTTNNTPPRNLNPLESTDMLLDDPKPPTPPSHKAPRNDVAYRKIQLMNDTTAMAFEWDSDTKGALCTIAQKQYDYKELYSVANDRIVFGVQSVAYNAEKGWVTLDIVSNDPADTGRKMNIFRHTKSGDETFDYLAIDKDMKALGWDGSNDWTFNFADGMFAVFKVSSKGDKTFWNFNHLYTITGLLPVKGGSAEMPF